jgi:CrcB protein
MNYLWVFVGGGLGSLVRYGITLLIGKWGDGQFPVATLISNFLATALLGIILYTTLPKWPSQTWIYPLIATGFCGGFSTFSTYSAETLHLIQTGNYFIAALNIFLSLVSGLAILFVLQRWS